MDDLDLDDLVVFSAAECAHGFQILNEHGAAISGYAVQRLDFDPSGLDESEFIQWQ